MLPENKLSRAQLNRLQELATGFGVLVAKQLHLDIDEDDEPSEEMLGESPLNALDASDRIVDDNNIVGYLEDCFNQDQ